MLASHAESMPSAPPTGASLSGRWLWATVAALSAIEGIRQALCGLGGHAMTLRLEKTRMSLHCMSCGHNTSGWTIRQEYSVVRK